MTVKVKKCKACEKKVATSAKACPRCGQKLKLGVGSKTFISVVAFLVLRIISSAYKCSRSAVPKTAYPPPLPTASNLGSVEPCDVVPTTQVPCSNVNLKVLQVTVPDHICRGSVKANPYGSWLIVKLRIQNNHKEAINVTSSNFKILDKDVPGFTHPSVGEVGLEVSGKKPLSFLTISPGNTVEGYLICDVSKDLNGFKMEASESVIGTPTRLIRQ